MYNYYWSIYTVCSLKNGTFSYCKKQQLQRKSYGSSSTDHNSCLVWTLRWESGRGGALSFSFHHARACDFTSYERALLHSVFSKPCDTMCYSQSTIPTFHLFLSFLFCFSRRRSTVVDASCVAPPFCFSNKNWCHFWTTLRLVVEPCLDGKTFFPHACFAIKPHRETS